VIAKRKGIVVMHGLKEAWKMHSRREVKEILIGKKMRIRSPSM
jgi:hypothetical protein